MKTFFVRLFYDIFFESKEKEHRARYLLINKNSGRSITNYTHQNAFECYSFSTLKEAREFLKNDVAKSDRRSWQLYQELKI